MCQSNKPSTDAQSCYNRPLSRQIILRTIQRARAAQYHEYYLDGLSKPRQRINLSMLAPRCRETSGNHHTCTGVLRLRATLDSQEYRVLKLRYRCKIEFGLVSLVKGLTTFDSFGQVGSRLWFYFNIPRSRIKHRSRLPLLVS